MSADLIRRGNRSKLAERSLLVVIDLLIGAKSILLYLIWHLGGKISNLSLYFFIFNFFNVITAP